MHARPSEYSILPASCAEDAGEQICRVWLGSLRPGFDPFELLPSFTVPKKAYCLRQGGRKLFPHDSSLASGYWRSDLGSLRAAHSFALIVRRCGNLGHRRYESSSRPTRAPAGRGSDGCGRTADTHVPQLHKWRRRSSCFSSCSEKMRERLEAGQASMQGWSYKELGNTLTLVLRCRWPQEVNPQYSTSTGNG